MTEDSGSGRPAFDPERIIETFNRHAVRYVVIGAVAALAHGAPVGVTFDVDFTPARDSANLERLSDALRELNARIRTADVAGGLIPPLVCQSLGSVSGMRTTIDKAGRLVIPKALRDRLGLQPGEVEVSADGSALRVEPVSGDYLVERNGRLVIPSSGSPLTNDVVRELRDADQR
jgi:AbrB family looped-hinge helix DNA binding protein